MLATNGAYQINLDFTTERLALVGRILEKARHIKFRTFGGVFNIQSFVHSLRSWPARECSPPGGLAILTAK